MDKMLEGLGGWGGWALTCKLQPPGENPCTKSDTFQVIFLQSLIMLPYRQGKDGTGNSSGLKSTK